jgi:hypothetical protein
MDVVKSATRLTELSDYATKAGLPDLRQSLRRLPRDRYDRVAVTKENPVNEVF